MKHKVKSGKKSKMKSGMVKTTIREIKGSLGRYLAIFAIVMLGVGLFAGLKATTPAMITTENSYLEEQNFFDFRLLSTIGFMENDTDKMDVLEKVADVEGAVSVDAICSFEDGNESVYKFHTVPDTISRVVVTAGRLPERADECVLDAAMYGADAIGSKIAVTDNNSEDTLGMFQERTYTAVGVVRSPYYINFERGTTSIGEGKITAFLYVPKEAFSCDYLTEIYVTAQQKYDVYTDEYENYIDTIQEEIENKTKELAFGRYEELTSEAEEKIEDAQSELDEKSAEARKELKDAQQKIQDGEQELRDGEQELRDGEQELADGEKKLADGEKEIAIHEQEVLEHEQQIAAGERTLHEKEQELQEAERQFQQYEQEFSENEQKLAAGKAELDKGKTEIKEQETLLRKQETQLSDQEAELSKKKEELVGQQDALKQQEKALEAQELELNSQREQLEQAYAMQYVTQEEYEQSLSQIEAGLAHIQGGRQELEAGKELIQTGLGQVRDGQKQIRAGKKEIRAGKAKIQSAKNEIRKKEKELTAADAELAAAKSEIDDARVRLESGRTEFAKGKAELESGRAELNNGKSELAKAREELVTAEQDLERAKEELENGRADVEKGKRELADAKTEYVDAKKEFETETTKAQAEIDDARAELADIEEPDYYVLNRNTNIGYACYESDSNIVAAIANVFPVFFFLVAALVCMTTMNRMIEEQRTQIGVLKALGYGDAAIMGKYLFYAGSAAVFGAIAGCVGGTWLFPKVIWMGYRIMYSMGDIQYIFDFRLAILSLAAAMLCSVGAAYFSCRHELYSVPANLIRPKAPKSGKRIFLEKIPVVWGRMKFLHKVSVRNVVRYKKRFFMMILGIGGCTALLVTGFGIKDSVTNIADMQYDEIQIYDIGITFKEDAQNEDMAEFVQQTNEFLDQNAFRYEESVEMDFGGRTKSVYMEIPENTDEIGIFLDLHTQSGDKIAYPSKGEAVLTAKIAENMGIRIGDQVVLRDNDMNRMTVTVSALCENFVYNYIYISKDTYAEQLGKQPDYKSAFVLVKDGVDIHEAAAAISDQDIVLSVSIISDMRERIATMMESMDYIVLLIIVCAGSLAFIVLYNLTNINITERIREIATIKVLGFYAKETADYVFRENLALTGLGAIVGLGLGKWLHWFVMRQVNIDMLSFKTMIKPMSYLWSLVLTFVFAMLVNALMYLKLEKINMAESLKSIE